MSTITTSEARCRDCYRCIRSCPVKAIGLKAGQAWVVEEKCILCGQCVGACPQMAKSTASQINLFAEWLGRGERVIVSLAPSYLALPHYSTPWKLVAALYKLGVQRVEETALAARWVAGEYARLIQEAKSPTLISGCCPVVVQLIEKYFPGLVPSLPGIVSPMLAHTRQLKVEWGRQTRVVFLGPCLGKKEEPSNSPFSSVLDAVLTFEELEEYLRKQGIEPESLENRFPDSTAAETRTYPLRQGILAAVGVPASLTSDYLSVTGVDECMEIFRDLEKGLVYPRFIEAMACKGGCVGGPAMGTCHSVAARSKRLLLFADQYLFNPNAENEPRLAGNDLAQLHRANPPVVPIPSEQEIRDILALTGKFSSKDETNCGGCGYSSCREKAIAVCQGLAEPEMCIPYMKDKAESFSNAIVETTLNAIIVVDQTLTLQKFNPAASRMFGMTMTGKSLDYFLDSSDFERVLASQETLVLQRSYPQGLITRQIIYPLPKYGVVIGIITDITNDEKRKSKMDLMRREALDRASRVIHEQMRIAQEIAGLLGESTSETKATLLELIEIVEGDNGNET